MEQALAPESRRSLLRVLAVSAGLWGLSAPIASKVRRCAAGRTRSSSVAPVVIRRT